jgi:hypothetical protein
MTPDNIIFHTSRVFSLSLHLIALYPPLFVFTAACKIVKRRWVNVVHGERQTDFPFFPFTTSKDLLVMKLTVIYSTSQYTIGSAAQLDHHKSQPSPPLWQFSAMESNDNADVIAMYFLLVLAILLGSFFICIGVVLVRLWIYRGALGPQPETFVVLPTYLRQRAAQLESPTSERSNKTHSVFPFPVPTSPRGAGPGVARLSHIPRINITAVNVDEEPDREVRAFFAEQQRISKLPTFVQDDCGDGSDFPDVPYADTRSDMQSSTLVPPAHGGTGMSPNNHTLDLKEKAFNEWLTVDTTHTKLHEARESLLVKKNAECIQVTHEGEAGCEELLQEVVNFLVDAHPAQYKFKTVFGRKQIRNELTKEEYALVQPFDCHPLEVCARLVNEDFNILAKGEFTQQYYLYVSSLSP